MTISKLKILQVTQFLDIGGLETVIIDLGKHLARNGYHVEMLCLRGYDPDYVVSLQEHSIPIHILKKKHKFDIRYFKRVASFIQERKFDIIHAHSGCFLYAALFSHMAKRNMVYTAHGMPIPKNLRTRLEDSIAALMTDSIVPVSHELENFLKKWLLFNRSTFKTITNGINTALFKPVTDPLQKSITLKKYNLPGDHIIIGSVGRLEPVKNYELLVRAFEQVSKKIQHASLCLVLVGEGSQKQYLEGVAEELGIAKKVHFLGMQYQINEIVPLFDVFVLCSLTEGTSISLLEEQSCSVPAVVTDVGGNSYIVQDGLNGFVVQSCDLGGLTEKLEELIKNQDLRQEMGKKARERVKAMFSINSMVKEYEKIYIRLL